MAISLERERILSLRDVPKSRLIPGRRSGSRLNVRTVFRWALDGLRGVRLETIMIGGTRCTSVEALERFFNRIESTNKSVKSEEGGQTRSVVKGPSTDLALDRLGL